RLVSLRGYGPTHERLSVCACLGALGVNVRICDPRFGLSQISWRTTCRHHATEDKPVSPCPCRIRPVRTCSTYNFKGRAPRAGPGLTAVHARAPRDSGADCRAAQRPRIAGWPSEDRGAPGAGCLPLAHSGHVGAGAHSALATDHMGSAPQRHRWRAGLQTAPSLRRPHSEALRARGQDRSRALASLRDPFGPLDRSATGIQGRLSERWPGPSATPPVAGVCSNRPGLPRLIAGHGHYKSARHAPSWLHWPYLLSSGSRVRILPGAPAKYPGQPSSCAARHDRLTRVVVIACQIRARFATAPPALQLGEGSIA